MWVYLLTLSCRDPISTIKSYVGDSFFKFGKYCMSANAFFPWKHFWYMYSILFWMFWILSLPLSLSICCLIFSCCTDQVECGGLQRSYRRAPRSAKEGKDASFMAGICHLCLAGHGEGGNEWEDLSLHQSWTTSFWYCIYCGFLWLPFSIKDIYIYIVYIWYICIIQHDHENISNTGQPRKIGERLISQSYEEVLPEPWDEESPWTQNLMTETGLQGKARFFKVDIWHVVHMGVAKDFISSALCLVQVLLDGSNVDCRFQHMTTLYKDWCKKNKKTKYLTKLTKDTVGGCGKRDEPAAGWNKAAVSTTLMEFTDYLCDLYREQCEQDERLRMVVSWRMSI